MPINTARIKAIWPWLLEVRYAWLSVIVILGSLTISLRPHTPEPVIRITGLVLQLLGVGTVTWGISETRALFGHPSLASKAKAWIGRFPLLRREIVLGGSIIGLSSVTGNARGYVTNDPGPNPTVETRLESLEKNVSLIHERINQTHNEMDQEFRKAEESLKLEKQLRQEEDNATREKLEATGTGGVHISAIGASWLFVGVTLSSASVEIASWLK